MLEAVVTNDVLVQMQLHANHSERTLVAIFGVAGAMRVGNGKTVYSYSFLLGSINNTVFFNLTKQLDTKQPE